MSEENFEGFAERECGEHRSTGKRAWCFNCTEWCYPEVPCRGCELPKLRFQLKYAEQAITAAEGLNGLVVPTRYREDVSKLAAAVTVYRKLFPKQDV